MFEILEKLDLVIWRVGFFIVLFVGLFFTLRSKFFQVRTLLKPRKHIKDLIDSSNLDDYGVHPIKLYFASIGGMIGLGNIVTVIMMLTIGGPGSLFWLWVTSLVGMIIKYSEIFLGIKHRVGSENRGYDGGPMYYLGAAAPKFKKILPIVMCVLLCIYGVEVSQFLILTDTFVQTFNLNRYIVILVMLTLVLISALGGVSRLADVCAMLMPPFVISYIIIGLWVIIDNADGLLLILLNVFTSAFQGHAPLGGFLGSSMLLAAQQGASRSVYSGDIGIGYDSIVQSETRSKHPEKQAKMAIFALVSNVIVCTISILLVLLTGLWTQNMKPSLYVVTALRPYIPFVDIYMAVLFFLAGFTTIVGYLVVGQKCAKFLNKRFGKTIYIAYASIAFCFFSFFSQEKV
ncbi:MAG: sodium:alanine symporter family protein, partial [Proteobacteria bacterium]|nr:sodium:alanine symporter family protein [Pseudomonadota bacterium]